MIYCIGDSFTFGAELHDTLNGNRCSNLAYPALLQDKLNRSVLNLGKQACSNNRMIKRAMDCVFKNDAELIIVAWTNPARSDIIDSRGVYSVWPGRNSSIMEINRQKITKSLTEQHDDKFNNWYHRNWLRQVILLQTFFKQHNIKYVMAQTHYSQWDNRTYERQNVDLLKHIDNTYFLGWPYEGFVEWTYGCKEGPNGHFLEEGHQKVADKLYEYIRTFGWFS